LADPSVLYALLGAVAGNMIQGDPVWLMLVGAPSSGGSEVLGALMGLEGVHAVGMVDSPAAFLSGTSKKERAVDATGGLLRLVGGHGALVLKDFTSMLSLPDKDLKKILSVFRECYDGYWARPTGTDGGKMLEWTGKMGLFAKVTGEIDRYHTVSASLGERWVFYRIPDDGNGFAKSMQALGNGARDGWRDELRDLVSGFYEGLGLRFNPEKGWKPPVHTLDDASKVRLIRMATIAARCRSSVVRDQFTRDKDIIAPPEREVEVRISVALGQFLLGMRAVGVRERECWRLVGKVALDSMPALRRAVVGAVWMAKDGIAMKDLQPRVLCSHAVVKRTVEDLEAHGVVERAGGGVVRMQDWIRKEWGLAWGEGYKEIAVGVGAGAGG